MATYLEEMMGINRMFMKLFPNRMIYQQIDDGTVEYHQPLNCYLVDYLHSKGMFPSYDSLMEYASNSNKWDKTGYSHCEYVGDEVSVTVEIESWRTKEKQKFAIKTLGHTGNYIKCKYRVWRLANDHSSKMHVVFETHYEHKLLQYLTKRGNMTATMESLGETSLEKELSEDEIAKRFLKICKTFKMKIEDDYIYGYIRKLVYVETDENDMGKISFMLYNEKIKDWEVVYETYSMESMKSKLKYIMENDLWDVPYNDYDKENYWWNM